MKYTNNPLITRTCPECGDRLQHANNIYGDQIVLSALYCLKHPLINFEQYKETDVETKIKRIKQLNEECDVLRKRMAELDKTKEELLKVLKGGDN